MGKQPSMRKWSRRISAVCFVTTVVIGVGCHLFSAETPVSNTLLRQILPELTNPRIMSLSDLTPDEQIAFKHYKFSFWLTGDFDLDNYPDIAIAGRFDNPIDPEDQAFVVILSKRKNNWTKEYFLRPKSRVVTLELKRHPDPQKNRRGYRSIVALFTGLPSDDYAVIYWNGHRYQAISGFDLIPDKP